ncbi:transcription initiation factor TFIID [Paenibacillus lentus]|uniref:Transcription initiation factor TFIID n=1 Tax=Paenibacillus lentus TaxID=1338368 RepID=A0A3Q8S8P4_9BACL|nr:transcription initiation factor TFIID [Paenibacillus lentus]AZK44996.1 transcription initiation factor TFIID [Paenibacillus lentus]
MVRQKLEQFAAAYDLAEERSTGLGDDQSSIHYPAVFLFIGDKCKEAIEPIMLMNEKKWENSEGLIYIHAGAQSESAANFAVSSGQDGPIGQRGQEGQQTQGWEPPAPEPAAPFEQPTAYGTAGMQGRSVFSQSGAPHSPRLLHYRIPVTLQEGSAAPAARRDIYRQFYEEAEGLPALNRVLRQASGALAEYGRLYPSFDRVRLSIITRVDDPLNVFVPEISLLAEAIFRQSFKAVQMDLYALISEREGAEAFGYSSSLGVAFLRELELMQQLDYEFSAPLHVTEDGISIPVTHSPSPLFDLVYVLSDRDERGIASLNGMQSCYEIISHISLLKNRQQKEQAWGANNPAYNNTSFKNNIMTESGRQGFVSAGLSKVKRPNQSIALAVIYHFYHGLLKRMKQEPPLSGAEKLSFFGLDAAALERAVEGMLPSAEGLSEMHGLMTNDVSYSAIRKLSLREAEETLFGGGGEAFFRSNFEEEAARHLKELGAADWLDKAVTRSLEQRPDVQLYALAAWTGEEDGGVAVQLRNSRRETELLLASAKAELEQFRQGRVEEQSFPRVPLMDRHNLRSLIRYLFDNVYSRRRDILKLELKLKLVTKLEDALQMLHGRYQGEIMQLEALERELRETALSSIKTADDYIGQNIMEYYERVTAELMEQWETKRGRHAFFAEGALGDSRRLMENGPEGLTDRLIEVCKQTILASPLFKRTFEEELLQRANVTVEYGNKTVLTKEELFKKLYRILEDNAAIQVRLYDYTQEHRYEEKYVFGDYTSELVRHIFQADETSRIYKLGCVHEQRSSGLEKLNLMGGFHLEDLMYYLNGKVYYETYSQNGYEFHGIDRALLPKLR